MIALHCVSNCYDAEIGDIHNSDEINQPKYTPVPITSHLHMDIFTQALNLFVPVCS